MKAIAAATVVFALTLPTAALADRPGRDWISSARASHVLASRGYRVVKIEADDGHWEGEARKGRMRFEFHVDPHSGRITKLERDRG